ncbi:MAG: Ycf51 family protein [Cyanobacteria bacterium P01_A01_bin.123]
MPTPEDFLNATQWAAIATVGLALLTGLAFLLKWGIRFRLVGITGFTGVLTVGLLGLSFEPFTRTQIPGAAPYVTVYDSGSAQIVITVPQTITSSALDATLRQAASDLLNTSRLGLPGQMPTIRARTIVHQEGGVSDLVYLGQVQPAPDQEAGLAISIDLNRLAEINADASS